MKRSGASLSNILLFSLFPGLVSSPSTAQSQGDATDIAAGMKRAATYFRETLALRGGYVYFYSIDLSQRWGEGLASDTEIWVQPPATPTVGSAFLNAYAATEDPYYLEAALETGRALLHGQLESGGWRNSIEFSPEGARVDQYRHGNGKGKNYSTLDDGISQGALQFLIELDRTCQFKEPDISEAAHYGLERLLAAQFSNGAFPQVWREPTRAVDSSPASYPEYDWRTEGRIKEYWTQFTLNDGVAGSVTELLITAHQVYKEPRILEALEKLGDFLILAQMPEPQPAWAQQYNDAMHPIWARAFEPPAISGRESEDVMMALLLIHEHSGDARYREPIVRAVKYLEGSLLDDGRMARYYELSTNRPLYMERDGKIYSLTYDDSRLPDHYGWKNEPRLGMIKAAYRAAISGERASEAFTSASSSRAWQDLLSQLDDRGRWVSTYEGGRLVGQAKFAVGDLYLSSEVFSQNLNLLSQVLRDLRGPSP